MAADVCKDCPWCASFDTTLGQASAFLSKITARKQELAELQRALEEPELRILALHNVSTSQSLGCVKF